MPPIPGVSVGVLLRSRTETFGLPLELLAGADGLDRVITSPHIQKTGLALAGFHEYLKPGRVLIFGESEIRYLESLETAARSTALRLALTLDFPCVVITGGFAPPAELLVEAERARLPLLKTPVPTPTAIAKLTSILEDSLAERTMMHAVLMDILGLGVLIVGESGIGKSECALDLIVRGHRLVADDTVEIRRRAETILIGTCPELTRHHMELRGLGVINVKDLFGIASTRSSKRVELVVQLERWEPGREYERLGLDDEFLRDSRPEGPADSDARRAGPKRGDSRRSGRAQSAAAGARPPRGAGARRAPGADAPRIRSCRPTTKKTRRSSPEGRVEAPGGGRAGSRKEPRRRESKGERGERRKRAEAGQPFIVLTGLSGPASRRRSARSKISATSASTTCRRR